MLARKQKKQEALPRHEELLLDYAERLRRHIAGRRAIHLHLSALRPQNRRPHHTRIAASSFDSLVQRHEGQCFRLRNDDLVVVVRDASVAQIDEVVLKLRYLFSEDPLALEDNDASQQPFCTWYDLEEDYAEFLATACRVNELAKQEEERRAGAEGTVGDGEVALAEMEPLDPARLGRLEEAITTADVSSLVRRQPVCAIAAGQKPTPIFEEVFVSIDELRRKVLPNVNIVSSRWLFQHLTEVLDRRLLQCLPEMEAETPANTSININVSTILSEQFLTFDRRLRHYTKKTVFLELQSVDVFADMGAYFFARDFARERGYMICLDGLGYLTFPMAPRDELGTDMQKLIWDADVLDQGSTTRADRLREAVKKAGPTRVILCRCDDHRALEFGQQIGISLFQGRYIDRIAQFIR